MLRIVFKFTNFLTVVLIAQSVFAGGPGGEDPFFDPPPRPDKCVVNMSDVRKKISKRLEAWSGMSGYIGEQTGNRYDFRMASDRERYLNTVDQAGPLKNFVLENLDHESALRPNMFSGMLQAISFSYHINCFSGKEKFGSY